jgi:hypothetical protein
MVTGLDALDRNFAHRHTHMSMYASGLGSLSLVVLPGLASTVLRTSMLHTLIHVHVGGSEGVDLRPAELNAWAG